MDITSELAGIQASLEYAVRMVGNISQDNSGKSRQLPGNSADICMRLDMVKDYLNMAQKRIDEIEGTMRYSYKDDLGAFLNTLDVDI
jgi:hypothetical protein